MEPADFVLVASAVGAGVFAYWRCRTADRNLRHQQYLDGIEMLSTAKTDDIPSGERYRRRVVGIATLAKLIEDDPREYDAKVVAEFEIFLSSPPVFKIDVDGHKARETDYESRDTIQATTALRKRSREWKRWNPPSLWPKRGPFIVDVKGDVVPNRSHEHYRRWKEAKGREPRC